MQTKRIAERRYICLRGEAKTSISAEDVAASAELASSISVVAFIETKRAEAKVEEGRTRRTESERVESLWARAEASRGI